MRTSMALVSLSMFGVASTARAAVNDSFQIQPSIGTVYDSNLFAVSDPSQNPLGGSGSAGTWMQWQSLDASFDHQYSRQLVHADVSFTHNQYDSFHFLDYNALDYNAQWQFQVGDRFSGVVSGNRTRYLQNYADFQQYTTPDLVTQSGQDVSFDWGATGPWHVVGAVLHTRVQSPSSFTEVGTFSQTDEQLGAGYESAAGNKLTFQLRHSNGTFDRSPDAADLLDNSYEQREAELLTHVAIGAISTLDTRVGYVERDYDHFAQRNYQGFVGSLSLAWKPTDRTSCQFSLSHNLVAYADATSSYYRLDQVSIAPEVDLTQKLSLTGSVSLSHRSFDGAITSVSSGAMRSDRLVSGQIKLNFKPNQTSTITLYASAAQRNSNVPTDGYGDRQFGIQASMAF